MCEERCCGDDAGVADRMIEALAGFLAELGACPPMKTTCPQRGKPITIAICTKCLREWAALRAKGD